MNFHTRVVDQNIKLVKVLCGLLNQPYGLLVLRNVRLDHQGLAVVLFDDLPHFIGFLLIMRVVHHHSCAFFGELNGNSAANAAIRACDNRHFII